MNFKFSVDHGITNRLPYFYKEEPETLSRTKRWKTSDPLHLTGIQRQWENRMPGVPIYGSTPFVPFDICNRPMERFNKTNDIRNHDGRPFYLHKFGPAAPKGNLNYRGIKTAILMTALLALHCKTQEKKQEFDGSAVEGPYSALEVGCYGYEEDNNVIQLEITDRSDRVQGNLTYALDGKDVNTGTLQGALKGDTLFAQYTFRSEGIESQRMVAFLLVDGQLLEGYGPMNESGTDFSEGGALDFTASFPLTRTECNP